jgi:site-specific recombinase XerD
MESAQGLLGHADTSMTKNYVRNRIGKLVKPTA